MGHLAHQVKRFVFVAPIPVSKRKALIHWERGALSRNQRKVRRRDLDTILCEVWKTSAGAAGAGEGARVLSNQMPSSEIAN